ncbi:hypothetical protein NE237_032325 [Protea cynaroides]|uniref:Uncharacterized protein n=1 Tax=Protea cynaroides TaxID=273540 RepID=A0A9Q0L2W0_9MAGN|nr:hypothetical protein NE237_032325 [Protea cynaroides]
MAASTFWYAWVKEEKIRKSKNCCNISQKNHKQFIWADEDQPSAEARELSVPNQRRCFLIRKPSCCHENIQADWGSQRETWFILDVNHCADERLVADAYNYMDLFFDMPLHEIRGLRGRHEKILVMPVASLGGSLLQAPMEILPERLG